MSFSKCNSTTQSGCKFNLGRFETYDLSEIVINGNNTSQLNWSEISIPEIVNVPVQKPDIEDIDSVYVKDKIENIKLIKTPFSYKVYERLATPLEVTATINTIETAVVDVQPIVDAVDAIITIPALPVIPQVAALQMALTAVTDAATALTTASNNALLELGAPCLAAATIVSLLEGVQSAVKLLQTALSALISAANDLVSAVATIPVVGPLVSAAITVLINAITTVTTGLLTTINAILEAITFIGVTLYFAIAPNEEGTCSSGRKIIVEGTLKHKIVYTALVDTQPVHSMHNSIPFTAFIIAYAKFEGIEGPQSVDVLIDSETCTTETIMGFPYNPQQEAIPDTCEEFCVDSYVEDVFAYPLDERTVFKNITLFLKAKPILPC